MRQTIWSLILVLAMISATHQAATFTKQIEHYFGTTNDWVQYNKEGIYVQVTFPAGMNFTRPPYVTSFLTCSSGCWKATGENAIYNLTNTGFRVYIHLADITVAKANSWKWKLNFKVESLD